MLRGKLYLSRIDKSQVERDSNGQPFIWVDVCELRQVGRYGNTHYIKYTEKYTNPDGSIRYENAYIADLRPVEKQSRPRERRNNNDDMPI